jgi:flagellar hook assembly protein FlgD
MPEDNLVNITIYDMVGRVVKTLININQTAGYHSIRWSATNYTGQPVSAGLYLYSIEAGDFRQTRKMVLLK